jgi:hypothetical protein
MDIVSVGFIGSLGVEKILELKFEELLARYDKRYLLKTLKEHEKSNNFKVIAFFKNLDIDEVIEVGEGGVLACLYCIAKNADCGINIEIKKIPLLQSSVEICDFFDINIYRLLSNSYILLCKSGYEIVFELRKQGVNCEVIGKLEKGRDKVIVDKEEYINRPSKDEIYKVVKNKLY